MVAYGDGLVMGRWCTWLVDLCGGPLWRTLVVDSGYMNFGGLRWWALVVALVVDFGLGLGRRTFVLDFGGGLWARFAGGLPW